MGLWGKSDGLTPCEGTLRSAVATAPAVAGACLARILILSEDQNRARQLAKMLRGQGYATSASDFSVTARKLGRDEHPDLALIDASDGGEKAVKLAHSLKSGETAHIPVVMVAELAPPAFRRRALNAGVDDVVIGPFSETILLLRLKPLVRLAIMRTELEHRIATARALGLKIDGKIAAPRAGEVSRILVTGAANRELDDVKKALDRDFDLVTAPDVFAAASLLHRESYDALVIVIDGNAEDALYLCGQIRNNTRLFNLPALLIADRGAFDSVEEPYMSGASVLILRPLDQTEIRTAIESLVHRQKLRLSIRDQLAAIQSKAGTHEVGGVYGRDFLLAHLDRLISASTSWRKHLSLVSFQVQNLAWVARDFGAAAANDLLRQVAEWISVLVRTEDMVARVGDKEFCVVLPETAIEDAEIVAHRISGVLLNTQFGINGGKDAVSVWLQAGCADFVPGDTAASLIERARHSLR